MSILDDYAPHTPTQELTTTNITIYKEFGRSFFAFPKPKTKEQKCMSG